MNITIQQLKQNADAMMAAIAGKPVQYRSRGTDQWFDAEDAIIELWWNCDATEYRPKPQPVSRDWSKPEDVPGPICWIRRRNCNWARLVIMVNEKRISCIDGESTAIKSLDFSELAEHHEYSTDRKTWHPCTVEDAK